MTGFPDQEGARVVERASARAVRAESRRLNHVALAGLHTSDEPFPPLPRRAPIKVAVHYLLRAPEDPVLAGLFPELEGLPPGLEGLPLKLEGALRNSKGCLKSSKGSLSRGAPAV